ncbi:MAG: tRNA (adenosine(37)-N6)-threonylcarbamoyltransferase complex transferase subunit TsaD [Bacteroidota bacterium]
MNTQAIFILGIESSCDETSASITKDGVVLSNIIASQEVHIKYGGVVPELASRAHQQQIVPVVHAALIEANITINELSAVAFTRGPGLIGALLVGCSFAKSISMALSIPLIEVNHMQAHIIGNFATREGEQKQVPDFPFLCLTISGGHTQLVFVESHLKMSIIGQTMDDAAGEAFDKIAKMLKLPYPGGPEIDKLAQLGNPLKFKFPIADIPGYDFSFSGLKTAVLYFLQRETKLNEDFIENNIHDICASIQHTIINTLMKKLRRASEDLGVKTIAISGGVSANKGIRKALQDEQSKGNWNIFIPNFEYCTDNAGMISLFGYYKFLAREFSDLSISPTARYPF